MVSIFLIAITVGIGTALLGSMAFQYYDSIQMSILSPLVNTCQQIADEGYEIRSLYPGDLQYMPDAEMKQITHLDERWMTECVAVLPAESIIDIASNVDRNQFSGE